MYARWRDESILSLPKEHCHAVFGAELDQTWKRVKARGITLSATGAPTGIRRFKDAHDDEDVLEISSVSDWRRHFARRLAEVIHRTRLAAPLARLLRGTRSGEWIKHRAVGKRVPKRAQRAARAKMERRALKVARRTAEKMERRALKKAERRAQSNPEEGGSGRVERVGD
jgi:hypothetical protein